METMLCQCCHVVTTRLRRSLGTRGLGRGRALCQSPEIENRASATDSPIGVELYAPQTPTDAISYHSHVGL